MAKKVLRLKLKKLLDRAAKQHSGLLNQAFEELGAESSFLSHGELEQLLKTVPNEIAEKVILLLGKFEGPAQTISPKYVELSKQWRSHLAVLEDRGFEDAELLARARQLTAPEKIHGIVPAKTANFEQSGWALYARLMDPSETEYDEALGQVSGVSIQEFREVVLPGIELGKRTVLLNMFVEWVPGNDLYVRSIREKFRDILCNEMDFRSGLNKVVSIVKDANPFSRRIHYREFFSLLQLLAAGREDYITLKLITDLKRQLGLTETVVEELEAEADMLTEQAQAA